MSKDKIKSDDPRVCPPFFLFRPAIEDGVCNDAASSSVIEGNHQLDLDRPWPAGPEQTSESPLKPTAQILEPQSTDMSLEDVQTLDVPKPLSTEIVLSTQKNQQNPRCRNPSLKPIQIIDPRPLPPRKARTSQSEPSAAQTSLHVYSYLCFDHDYCGSVDHPLQAKQPSEANAGPEPTTRGSGASGGGGGHLSDNQASVPLQRSDQTRTASEAETRAGEASPPTAAVQGGGDGTALCGLPTPPPTPPVRGRSKRRYRRRSPRSDSSSSSCSSSCSCSPKRPRVRRGRSESSSCSSSPSSSSCASPPRRYRMSCPRSWSRSRSRSPSPQIYHRSWRDVSSSRESRRRSREHEMRIQKLKAIDERRVVYVGRIRRTMTHDELRERFSQFGEVECVSLHFRDSGDHYGFVTFYNTEDAFAAIDNGGKLRRPNELPFDLCFGGRRQFCNSDYADLDANREADPPPPRSRFEDLDFDSLLKQAQKGQKR
uniref:RRM domain-containing protein n=1 Tax=Fundulus heteroclitus TaxID=8078 RepID=A0A3Q2PUA5_FUNHE